MRGKKDVHYGLGKNIDAAQLRISRRLLLGMVETETEWSLQKQLSISPQEG